MDNFRPLKMLHGYAYPEGSDTQCKMKAAERRIDDLHEKGYGGIVTNVDFYPDYLKSSESWDIFRHAVQYAADKYGMKIWIYDENGYPSGTAGGLTLKEDPDFECKALAMVCKSAKAGECITIDKPRGHIKVVSAYAVTYDNVTNDLYDFVAENGTLKYTAPEDCTVYYFVTKRLYEGTHAQHNTCASRRYISLINKKAVGAFIRNTYKAYTDHIEGLDLPEGSLQAFFTDEPSFQACYINAGLNPQAVDDPYDTEMPLYPIVAWENGMDKIYSDRYGEDIRFRLHMLFESDNTEAKRVRFRFYKMLSGLYEEAFFKQISEFCREHGIAFSGHLLLEENILHHPLFEGNFFDLIRHMHIPGIDMLFTKPESVMRFAATPKLVSSAASWYARPHVMSEISGHTENALNIPFDIYDIICAQLLQFVLGVDIFNSYFDDDVLTQNENRLLCGSVENVCREFSGKISMADILLYYPVESAQVSVKGSAEQLQNRPYDSAALKTEESWRAHIDALLRDHYMFDCVSCDALSEAEPQSGADNGSGVIRNPRTGHTYDVLIVPRLSAITCSALESFIKAAEAGVPVIVNDMSDCIVADGCGEDLIRKLLSYENVKCVSCADECMRVLHTLLQPPVCSESKDTVMLAKKDPSSGRASYLIVNISENPVSEDIVITKDTGCLYTADPVSDEPPKWEKTETVRGDRGTAVRISIAPLGAVLIKED